MNSEKSTGQSGDSGAVGYRTVANAQARAILLAMRSLICSDRWTVNEGEKSAVLNTNKGCFVALDADRAKALSEEVAKMGQQVPSDRDGIARILVMSGAAKPSNLIGLYWSVTAYHSARPIACIRIAHENFIFMAPPNKINVIV